jgi:hypothetical protein
MSGTPLQPSPPLLSEIRIRGLRKSFGDQTVLAGVDLDIGRGDNLVLFGGKALRARTPSIACNARILLSEGVSLLQRPPWFSNQS